MRNLPANAPIRRSSRQDAGSSRLEARAPFPVPAATFSARLAVTLAVVFVAISGPTARGSDAPNAETKLRETLRATMLQLRTAQTDNANLQTTQAESDAKVKVLTAKVEALSKQLAADKQGADKTIADLREKTAAQETQIATLNESLAKWKTSQQQAAELATKTEGQRAKLAEEAVLLKRKVAEQQMKNAAMFKLGNEILLRYEKFGLGDALTAREPFVGITRVKFENLMQDYGEKLLDQKIKP